MAQFEVSDVYSLLAEFHLLLVRLTSAAPVDELQRRMLLTCDPSTMNELRRLKERCRLILEVLGQGE